LSKASYDALSNLLDYLIIFLKKWFGKQINKAGGECGGHLTNSYTPRLKYTTSRLSTSVEGSLVSPKGGSFVTFGTTLPRFELKSFVINKLINLTVMVQSTLTNRDWLGFGALSM
jgi:hypothetical protein